MKRVFSIVYIAVVCLLLLVPGMISWTRMNHDMPFADNRAIATQPALDVSHLDPFPAAYEHYYNDHFPYRNTGIYLLNYMDAFYFGKSPAPYYTIIGENTWLFNPENIVQRNIGMVPVADSIMNAIIAEINVRGQWCREHNAEFRVVIIPAKSSIYPEHLPLQFKLGIGESPIDILLKRCAAESEVPILYLRDSLLPHKADYPLFLRTESHWTDYATYFGYQSIINWLFDGKQQPMKVDLSNVKKEIRAGDYSKSLGFGSLSFFQDTFPVLQLPPNAVQARAKENYPCNSSWFAYCNEYEWAYQNTDTTLPGLLVIRDSFTNPFLQSLLSQHFGRSTFIWDYWQHKLNKEIVEKEKPKMVICIMNEMFFTDFWKYRSADETGGENCLEVKPD